MCVPASLALYDKSHIRSRSAGNTFRLHADADVRVGLSAERLSLVQARLSRHPNFATLLPGSEHAGHVAITRIDRLSVAPAGTVVTLLGTLTQAGRRSLC